MSDQPGFFLVIKEPPFPAAYNKETYLARTLEEMRPSYSYAEFSSSARLMIRRLPDSSGELNDLIVEVFPNADLDRTSIQSFEDTNGGQGIRVTIYKADIAAEADSVAEARQILLQQVPEGRCIRSERVVSQPEWATVTGVGSTEHDALKYAQRQVPSHARVVSTRTIRQPGQSTVAVTAFSEQEAKATAQANVAASVGSTIASVNLISRGRSGIFGIGRTPNQYECELHQKAVVEISYSRGKAKLVAVLAPASIPKQRRNEDFVEVRTVDDAATLLAAGVDVNAKDAKGKTALMNASYYGRKDLVRYLLDRGADVNARYIDGCTALIWAAGEGETEIAEILLQNGADVRATERHGYTAQMIASKMNRSETATMLARWERRA